jgi:hypothetical protein
LLIATKKNKEEAPYFVQLNDLGKMLCQGTGTKPQEVQQKPCSWNSWMSLQAEWMQIARSFPFVIPMHSMLLRKQQSGEVSEIRQVP